MRLSLPAWMLVLATLPAAAQLPPDLVLAPVVTVPGQPIGVRHAGDGSGRLFVIDRSGSIRVVLADGSLLPTPFLRVEGSGATPPPFGFSPWGEGGLLGLAFHPQFAANRRVFIQYTDGAGDLVLAGYRTFIGDGNRLDPASAQVLLRIDVDGGFHLGGDLAFGLDGLLYLAVGDGGGGTVIDACRRGQTRGPAELLVHDGNHPDCTADAGFVASGGNPDSRALQAKILRLDVDQSTPAGSNELCGSAADGSAPYAIPAGNPYAGASGGAGHCDETWAWGLRNPYRISFDRGSGDVFIADVGEGEVEEVNWQAAGQAGGRNYGWSLCEGTLGHCPGTLPPSLSYTHAANGPPCSSITGGYRYRGAIPGLRGLYVFSDFCTGRLRYATQDGAAWQVIATGSAGPFMTHAGFGEDEAGELYLAEFDGGRILRFASASADVILRSGFELP